MTNVLKDEEYNLGLNGEEISKLFGGLEEIKNVLAKHGHSYQTQTFSLSEENTEGVFLQIADKENKDFIIEKLRDLESENFENLGDVINTTRLNKLIQEITDNINNASEDYWQNLLKENPWVFNFLFTAPIIFLQDETYLGGKNTKGRSGQGGVATDFLLENTSNNTFNVVEIKTPKKDLVKNTPYRSSDGVEGGSNEVYSMSDELTGGIVQMENQIYIALKYFKTELGEDFDLLDTLDPRGVLLIGKISDLTEQQKKSFNLFRKTMGSNQVITFDELLDKLITIRDLYKG